MTRLTSGSITLDIPSSAEDDFPGAESDSNRNLSARIIEALNNPLGLPPVHQCVVPGDQVVIVTDPETPHLTDVIVHVWEALNDIGEEGVNLTLLFPEDPSNSEWNSIVSVLPLDLREKISVQVHDPSNEESRCYLASSANGERIYLAKELIDADLIINIGMIGYDSLLGYKGTTSSIYPAMSDASTIQEARRLGHHELSPDDQRPLRDLIDEIGWLLGTQFAVQVVPSITNSEPQVYCGMSDQVFEQGKQFLTKTCRIEKTFQEDDLLLVSIPGGKTPFDWTHLGAASEVASHLMPQGGRVAIVADCTEPTGSAATMLRRCDEPDELIKPLSLEPPEDGISTLQLIRALQKIRLYLYSPLPDAVVEELGMQPLSNEVELRRLIDSVNEVHVIPNVNYGCADQNSTSQ